MRRLAGTTLALSALFLAIVAILSDAPALFYMGTALLATIGTSRIQAYLSVRGLRFQRFAPELAHIGEHVKVELVIWSEKKIRRPLIHIKDQLPARFLIADLSPSLPIAPDFDFPVRTEYNFRPRRRGIYRWSGLEAVGTDALGLVTMNRTYTTDVVEMTVLPLPIPVLVDLPAAAGWGVSEASSGENKGPSGEPRGIREYVQGDSLRHVHWRSSARTGLLHVKEFEAGSHTSTAMMFQRQTKTDLIRESDIAGTGPVTSSLDLMVGHALHVSENLLRQGAKVTLPQFEDPRAQTSIDRRAELAVILADVQADSRMTLGEEIIKEAESLRRGSLLMAFLVKPDETLLTAISHLRTKEIQLVALLYDAQMFTDAKDKRKPFARSSVDSASDPSFVEAIRAAGAYPILMPSLVGSAT